MDLKLVQSALDALSANDQAACEEILKSIIAAEAADGDAGMPGEPPADAGATAENADAPPPAQPGEPAPAGTPEPDPQKREHDALARELVTLSGRPAGEALEYFRTLHTTAAQRAADAAVLEAGERRALVTELVQLGAEVPAGAAGAWENPDATGDARVPCRRLAAEPLADLRARVAALRSNRPQGARPPAVRPPAPAPKTSLTREEQEYCTRNKITAEEFAARKASAVKRSK